MPLIRVRLYCRNENPRILGDGKYSDSRVNERLLVSQKYYGYLFIWET